MRRFWEWIKPSIINAHNFPHYLTAIFTLALAVFAYNAWIEAQRGTHALEGQLLAIRAEQRPYIGPVNIFTSPFFTVTPDHGGQIEWNIYFTNYGKSVAYDEKTVTFIKVGDEPYQKSYSGNTTVIYDEVSLPPGKINFVTAVSWPGYSQEFFDGLLKKNKSIGVLVEFEYSDTLTGGKYHEAFCAERLANGAITFRDPKKCQKQEK
jgi:hypothetical protein